MQLRTAASGARSSSSLLLFADVRGVCPSRCAARVMLLHNSSTHQEALGAAQNALLQAAAALVGDVVEVVIFRCFEQHVVARLELVDELELERANTVPVLTGRDGFDVDLRPVLANLCFE